MERLRHLVVVVPGIGGSVLAAPDGTTAYEVGRRTLAKRLLSPGVLDLDGPVELTPVGLIESVTVFPGFTVAGYEGLVNRLTDTFQARVDVARPGAERDLAADVVLFPYDFRVGIAETAQRLADEIAQRLVGFDEKDRLRRVIVIGHSMGGLVARYWLGPLQGARYCRGLVTAGTPHRGAPKALDWLVNGVRFGPIPYTPATRVLRAWPSVYDLLPRYPVARNEQTGALHHPHELTGVATPDFLERAAASYRMHTDIEKAWTELAAGDSVARPELVPLFARGHATPSRVTVDKGRLRVRKQPAPDWLPEPGWQGDGTVPAISAIPIELDGQRAAWQAVVQRHVPMAGAPAIVEAVRNLNGESLAWVRGDRPEGPWLGLDLDDCAAQDTPVEVAAWLHGVDPAAAGSVRVWLTVKPLDPPESGVVVKPPRVPMTAVEDRWEATVEPLAAGMYEVTVEAVNVPEVDRVVCRDVLAVLEP